MADNGAVADNGSQISSTASDFSSQSDDEAFPVSASVFENQFDESILQTLDINSWRLGSDLGQEYRRMERGAQSRRIRNGKAKRDPTQGFPATDGASQNTHAGRTTHRQGRRHNRGSQWTLLAERDRSCRNFLFFVGPGDCSCN